MKSGRLPTYLHVQESSFFFIYKLNTPILWDLAQPPLSFLFFLFWRRPAKYLIHAISWSRQIILFFQLLRDKWIARYTAPVSNYVGTHLLPQHVIESERWSLDLCSCGFTTCIIICSKSPDVSFCMISQLYVSNSSFVVGIKSCLHVGICRPLVEARAWFSSAQLYRAAVECEEQRNQKTQNFNYAQEESTIALAYNDFKWHRQRAFFLGMKRPSTISHECNPHKLM